MAASKQNQQNLNVPKKRGPVKGLPQRGGTPSKAVIFDDPKNIKLLQEYAGNFLTNDQIAACFGISKAGFYNILNSRPALRELMGKAKNQCLNELAKGVVKDAKRGGKNERMFVLKAHGGWKEKHEIEITGEIDINLDIEVVKRIDQLSPEQRARRLGELVQLDAANTEVIDVEFDE